MPWQINSTLIIIFFPPEMPSFTGFLKFPGVHISAQIPGNYAKCDNLQPSVVVRCSHLMIYFVPLPFPLIVITPFSPIAFNNCVVFDLPNGTYGAISLIGFNIVLLKSL